MAVNTNAPEPGLVGHRTRKQKDASGTAIAPGRHQLFEINPNYTPLYRVERTIFVTALWTWSPPEGALAREHVPETGPVILAPVHRSFADFGFCSQLTAPTASSSS